MKFTVGRLDILAGQALAPPLFGLPGRAPELFEALYGELNEQLPMRLEDLQIAGGTAYSDFKMTMKSGESFQADIGANGFFVRLSEIADRERFKTLVNTYETTLQNLFPKTVFVDSFVRLHAWLKCEGGMEAVDTDLRARGDSAFRLQSHNQYSTEYTLRTTLTRPDQKLSVSIKLERSAVPNIGDLYAESNVTFNRGNDEKRLAAQLDIAIELSEQILRDAGFEVATS